MSRVTGSFRNVQTIFLIITIVFGALYLFWDKLFPPEEAARDPRADVNHEIFSACLDGEHRWVRAMVEVRNVGNDVVNLGQGDHFVMELLPASERLSEALTYDEIAGSRAGTLDWSRFAERREVPVLPGESAMGQSGAVLLATNEAHRVYLDILVTPDAEVIEVSSYYQDQETGESGPLWEGYARTLYAIREDRGCAE